MHSLNAADRMILTEALNWVMHVPFTLTKPPSFSQKETEQLSGLLNALIGLVQSGNDPVELNKCNDLFVIDSSLYIDAAHYRLLIVALEAYGQEVSPSDIEVIIGLPSSLLPPLLSRLQNGFQLFS